MSVRESVYFEAIFSPEWLLLNPMKSCILYISILFYCGNHCICTDIAGKVTALPPICLTPAASSSSPVKSGERAPVKTSK